MYICLMRDFRGTLDIIQGTQNHDKAVTEDGRGPLNGVCEDKYVPGSWAMFLDGLQSEAMARRRPLGSKRLPNAEASHRDREHIQTRKDVETIGIRAYSADSAPCDKPRQDSRL